MGTGGIFTSLDRICPPRREGSFARFPGNPPFPLPPCDPEVFVQAEALQVARVSRVHVPVCLFNYVPLVLAGRHQPPVIHTLATSVEIWRKKASRSASDTDDRRIFPLDVTVERTGFAPPGRRRARFGKARGLVHHRDVRTAPGGLPEFRQDEFRPRGIRSRYIPTTLYRSRWPAAGTAPGSRIFPEDPTEAARPSGTCVGEPDPASRKKRSMRRDPGRAIPFSMTSSP